jgi:hypothetical protein
MSGPMVGKGGGGGKGYLGGPILDPRTPQDASFFRECSVLVGSTVSLESACGFVLPGTKFLSYKSIPKGLWEAYKVCSEPL